MIRTLRSNPPTPQAANTLARLAPPIHRSACRRSIRRGRSRCNPPVVIVSVTCHVDRRYGRQPTIGSLRTIRSPSTESSTSMTEHVELLVGPRASLIFVMTSSAPCRVVPPDRSRTRGSRTIMVLGKLSLSSIGSAWSSHACRSEHGSPSGVRGSDGDVQVVVGIEHREPFEAAESRLSRTRHCMPSGATAHQAEGLAIPERDDVIDRRRPDRRPDQADHRRRDPGCPTMSPKSSVSTPGDVPSSLPDPSPLPSARGPGTVIVARTAVGIVARTSCPTRRRCCRW